MELTTRIEPRASDAGKLEAFSYVNLYGIKEGVAKPLEFIGKDRIFDEYTRRDISHINKLSEIMEWIIPATAVSKLTMADCLMLTLAVYFHDLGMVVTPEEYERRHESSFPEFKKTVFEGDQGKDYHEKVAKMRKGEAERFLYQEFVRQHHAERIRQWISGKSKGDLGIADRVISEVGQLLKGLDDRFRKDLGLICESHHLDDLDDLAKYKVLQPYGSRPQETVNLQYCAIVLRTADVLHVTKDRAPSISFRMINPSDPKSIEEWRKQMSTLPHYPYERR